MSLNLDTNQINNFDITQTKKIELNGSCNTSDEILADQVNHSIRLGLRQVKNMGINPNEALLICGGASLKESEKDLVKAYWEGGKVVCTNGSYNWCLEKNIRPSACVILDARESNYRFLETNIPSCKYLLASQCHPKVFEVCKDRDVYIWHACSGGDKEFEILNDFYFGKFNVITLGTTVGVRTISLLRLLGFNKIQIFGLDSCWMNLESHAYEQKENENDKFIPVWLRPTDRDDKAKRFICSPWMIKQAEDFIELIEKRGELFDLEVHGDGLIANMLKIGFELQIENQE